MSAADSFPMQFIAHVHSDFSSKFGIPRQSGLVDELRAVLVFTPPYRDPAALRGLEGFSHLWLLWQFSAAVKTGWSPTVRPPRLGGNTRMGVFATRSPYRPNPIGLSCVRLVEILWDTADGPVLVLAGADLMDGTPVFDIKPYLPYTDCRPDAAAGFATENLNAPAAGGYFAAPGTAEPSAAPGIAFAGPGVSGVSAAAAEMPAAPGADGAGPDISAAPAAGSSADSFAARDGTSAAGTPAAQAASVAAQNRPSAANIPAAQTLYSVPGKAALTVDCPAPLLQKLPPEKRAALIAVLAQDPRPAYQRDPARVYGFGFAGFEVRFFVRDGRLTVTDIRPAPPAG